MASPLRIGLAGLGTVGATVAQHLIAGAVEGVCVSVISARDATKDRGFDTRSMRFVADPLEMATAEDVDVVVELIGGQDGPAYELVQASLAAGKPVITANKAMLAAHAEALSELSVNRQGTWVPLAYEAAVAGGIPVIKTLREGLAGNQINRLAGILNGTCNYILTRMEEAKLSFEDALLEAQDKGFAEADPALDVSGVDAAQKLSILSALAFGLAPDYSAMQVDGIEAICAQDISFAGQFDCVIRLVGVTQMENGSVYQRVTPMLVRRGNNLAQVRHELNAISVQAAPVGELFMQGPGAGGGATASAVLGDIADVALGFGRPLFSTLVSKMTAKSSANAPECEYYLRVGLADKPGSMAKATQILAENGVSIEEVVQRSSNDGGGFLPVVFITHEVDESSLNNALLALQEQQEICNGVLSLPIFADGL
ncbi:homoserine dehydrogenase [Alphaproteobacteria bacterium]|nr:homoserine dehydrogenase [Alphaproteobacteria bacterium]MDC0147718.1 homoserine dehydrogenase [Alphaproteobacteria bacterium]